MNNHSLEGTGCTLALTIDLGNEAMQDGADVATALREVAQHFEAHGFEGDVEGRVRDANGNTVGKWELA